MHFIFFWVRRIHYELYSGVLVSPFLPLGNRGLIIWFFPRIIYLRNSSYFKLPSPKIFLLRNSPLLPCPKVFTLRNSPLLPYPKVFWGTVSLLPCFQDFSTLRNSPLLPYPKVFWGTVSLLPCPQDFSTLTRCGIILMRMRASRE
jgi:hypothetical protein